MQKSCIGHPEKKAREKTSSTTSHALPPGTKESEISTEVVTPRENNYPLQEKLKKEIELSTAKKNLQGQNFFKQAFSMHCIPIFFICSKIEKSRFAVTNMKRELKSKYLTIRISNHPISRYLVSQDVVVQALGGNQNMPLKNQKPSSKYASGITIRSVCVSMLNPSHTEGTAESNTNPRMGKSLSF